MAARGQIFALLGSFPLQTFRAPCLHMQSRAVGGLFGLPFVVGGACGDVCTVRVGVGVGVWPGTPDCCLCKKVLPATKWGSRFVVERRVMGQGAEFLAWSGGGVWLVLLGQAMGWQWSTVFVVAVSGIALSPQARGHGAGDCVHHVGGLLRALDIFLVCSEVQQLKVLF